jgi:putative molybdopterin biosynthesis protein
MGKDRENGLHYSQDASGIGSIMKRNIYLEDIALDEAQRVFREALEEAGLWEPLPAETIPVSEANRRVTAEAIFARLSSPHYHASAMDGYAVRARDTVGATETLPLQLQLVKAGAPVDDDQRPAQAVNTGHPLPGWANAVIMIEHAPPITTDTGEPGIEIRAAVPPWHHVRPMGEDMVASELILPANHKLRPVDLGALAGSGHNVVSVYRRPRVTIIPTGSELVSLEEMREAEEDDAFPVAPGQIIEYNSIVLASQIENWGGIPVRRPIIPDHLPDIRTAVQSAVCDSDLVLINAGSSAGSEDYTSHVVGELGRLLVHGIAIRPGHPVILGMLQCAGEDDQPGLEVPVIGVPGYPVSAALTGEVFVEPLLAHWQGQRPLKPPTLEGTLTRKVVSHTGDDDYVRVSVGKVGDKLMVTPISRGAGVITSLVRADGILRIPRFSEGQNVGDRVTVHLYRTPQEIERTIVAIGSHDLTLDVLAQYLAERTAGLRLMSANVGSMSGLVALRRGEAHLAGSHLLDPQTGIYNESYVRRYLPDTEVVLVKLVGRQQGWIVPKGNPLVLSDWADILNPDLQFVNRQRGAGTRVLLDYELSRQNIDPTQVIGYDREEFTHLAVAAAVASGAANAGLGIRAAAEALDLDFVPLASEQYELVIPSLFYESELLRPLLELLHDKAFQQAVEALPGYDISAMGEARSI